ncbi:MAG: NAD(P)/FAD-dependent oxidoreductase [Clostridia bacterium]|nr:NAD(P)/FAD-dependent oxidoreductase [Clostridia bacterium]
MDAKKVIIIGGGPAGLAAAIEANNQGIAPDEILILERDRELGGILNQCIHAGFGLHMFGEEMTGPAYAGRFIDIVKERKIGYLTDSMVLSVNEDRQVSFVSPTAGYQTVQAGAIVLAMGCRERTRGALNIAGTRPAGIYSAGTAQRYVNIDGFLPGKRVVILGSGDIGLIMARRLTLEGAKVLRVCELMPYSGGLPRNIAQCLNDFDIPLYLSHTVVDIKGKERVEGVTIAEVGPDRKPIPGTEEYVECDTLLLSVGLLPENELTREAGITLDRVTGGAVVDETMQTSVPGIYACGNVLHVHDLVDFVTREAYRAGASAAAFAEQKTPAETPVYVPTKGERGVRYIMPQHINANGPVDAETALFFRVDNNYKDKVITLSVDGVPLATLKKRRLEPGQMESIKLGKAAEAVRTGAKQITVTLEEIGG